MFQWERSILPMQLSKLLNAGLATRFISVGVINTAFGYAIILVGLAMGLGDITANLLGYGVGFLLSFAMHRRITFQDSTAYEFATMARYAIAVLIALGINLLIVVLAGSLLKLTHNPLVHLVAIGAYAVTLYVCSATFVFKAKQK